MIEVDLPDGSVAEFPDGTPPDVIKGALRKKFGAPQAEQASPQPTPSSGKSVGGFVENIGSDAYDTAAGIVGGIYAGGRKLVTDPVGAAGDVYNAGDTFGAAISGGLGHLYNAAVPSAVEMTPGPDMNLASKVGGHLKDRYWDNLGNTLYEHPVQSAMDAASLAYGGQAVLPKAMVNTRKALGTVAEVTNPLNAVAKPVQALRGTVAERNALRQMRKEAPSYDAVVADKNALYDSLDNAGIQFDANSYNQMLGRVSHKLRTFREKRAPLTSDAVSNMATMQGKTPSFRDVEEMLIEAKSILREPNASNADKAAAHVLVDELNGFFNKSPLTTNGSMAAGDVAMAARQARELARRHIVARDALEIERKSKWYTSGDESGLRNQYASYGKRNGKSLTPAEEKAMKKVVKREGAHGLLNTGGSKLTQTLLLGGLGMGVGIPAAIAGGALSAGARAASAAMTNAKARQFMETVLAGRDAQNAALAKGKMLPLNTKVPLLAGQGVSLLEGRR